jgi:hypothetical protein
VVIAILRSHSFSRCKSAFDPVHDYVGEDAARRHDLLAGDEAGWHADRFRPTR